MTCAGPHGLDHPSAEHSGIMSRHVNQANSCRTGLTATIVCRSRRLNLVCESGCGSAYEYRYYGYSERRRAKH